MFMALFIVMIPGRYIVSQYENTSDIQYKAILMKCTLLYFINDVDANSSLLFYTWRKNTSNLNLVLGNIMILLYIVIFISDIIFQIVILS